MSATKLIASVLLIIVSVVSLTLGRAGGAGHSSSSGSSHSSSHSSYSSHSSSSSYSSSSSDYSSSTTSSGGSYAFSNFLVILVIGIMVVGFSIRLILKKAKAAPLVLDELIQSDAMKEFLKSPDFNETDFKNKVTIAFTKIQHAWSKKDLSSVRRFISDGVYQRFTTQFQMMNQLQQTNIIDNPEILALELADAQSDSTTDTIHARITAFIDDSFVCELNHALDNSGETQFVEYWSFTRKKNNKNGDIYNNENCPSCGAPLSAISDVCTCSHCGVLINSGEYDWVLSEITQNDDWAASTRLNCSIDYIKEMTKFSKDSDFSIQVAEDKASNGYMQILAAITSHEPARLRRFVTDDFYKKLCIQIKDEKIVFNELFLNEVTLMSSRTESNRTIISVGITVSYQRLKLVNSGIEFIDNSRCTKNEVLIMERIKSDSPDKGSTFVNQCSGCGAPADNSLDNSCSYCGSVYNSGTHDWVISNILDTASHKKYLEAYTSEFDFSVQKNMLDNLFSIKEYALNNVLVMIAADGRIDDKELAYAQKIAKRWSISQSTLPPLIDMANSGRLSIRIPDDRSMCESIRKLILRAAEIDGDISEKEIDVIRQFDRQIAS